MSSPERVRRRRIAALERTLVDLFPLGVVGLY
jgi:hypothetical protein